MSVQTDPVIVFQMPNSNIRMYQKERKGGLNTLVKEVDQDSTSPSPSSRQSVHGVATNNKMKTKVRVMKKNLSIKLKGSELNKSQKSLQGGSSSKSDGLNSPVNSFTPQKLQTEKPLNKDLNSINELKINIESKPLSDSESKVSNLKCFSTLESKKHVYHSNIKNKNKNDDIPPTSARKVHKNMDPFFDIEEDEPSLDNLDKMTLEGSNISPEEDSQPDSKYLLNKINPHSNVAKLKGNKDANNKFSVILDCKNESNQKIIDSTKKSVISSNNSSLRKCHSPFSKGSISQDMSPVIFSEMRTDKPRKKKKNVFKFISQNNTRKTINNLSSMYKNKHGKDKVMSDHQLKTKGLGERVRHQTKFFYQSPKHKPTEVI